jgi:hypothetical protein
MCTSSSSPIRNEPNLCARFRCAASRRRADAVFVAEVFRELPDSLGRQDLIPRRVALRQHLTAVDRDHEIWSCEVSTSRTVQARVRKSRYRCGMADARG